MKAALALITINTITFLLGSPVVLALNPSLDVSRYTHNGLTVLDAFSVATMLASAQTQDGGDLRDPSEAEGDSRPHQLQNARGSHAVVRNLKFTHLTTNDGLSQGYVTAILQDRRGFMWFATRDGLNRYDGNSFVVYKNNPNDPGSLSSNFIQDLIEDDRGYLWIATNTGVNKFDPTTERCTRYLHDPNDPNSLGGAYVTSIARGSRGNVWFGTQDSGLYSFDPTTGPEYLVHCHILDHEDNEMMRPYLPQK